MYDGDLMDDEKVLSWLTSQDVFEIKDEIEEVNRKMLEKLLDENDFVAVYFCKQSPQLFLLQFSFSFLILVPNDSRHAIICTVVLVDERNCKSCKKVLDGLERIDQETDALDITFVKVSDPRYAKKYGVNKLPSLVYFRRKFPSIYRGEYTSPYSVFF